MSVTSLEIRRPDDVEDAFEMAARARVEAVVALSSRLVVASRQRILALAASRRLPVAGGWGPWAEDGAVLGYGPDVAAIVRRAATHVDRILKGARPADLPVEPPARFRLVVNVKAARALGLDPPRALLARADRVIQ